MAASKQGLKSTAAVIVLISNIVRAVKKRLNMYVIVVLEYGSVKFNARIVKYVIMCLIRMNMAG